jgi:phage gpG-like protein
VARFLTFDIEIEGVKQVSRAMAVREDRVQDLRTVWREVAADFARLEKTVFNKEGALGGWQRWKALAPATQKEKARKYGGNKILVRSGRLRMSLTNPTSPEFVFISMPLSVELGTRVPYAKYHQKGTSKMAKREPIRITEAGKKRWVKMIQAYLVKTGQLERKHA